MRYIGIDYGSKKIGVAISDPSGRIAFPKIILSNDADAFSRLKKIIEEEHISQVVIGESKDFSGKENKIMEDIKIFTERIKKELGLEPIYELEYLSSSEARRIDSGKADDARAAAIVLQSYLDRINNNL